MKVLTLQEIQVIHFTLVDVFDSDGDPIEPPGVKDGNLLASASERPNTSLGAFEKYDTLEKKCAALFHSLVKNHAFYNGNKRTALVSLVYMLDINKKFITASDDEQFKLVIDIAKDAYPFGVNEDSDSKVDYISKWIVKNSASHDMSRKTLSTVEFLKRCEQMGVRYKKSSDGLSHVISHNNKTISIAIKTKRLNGNVQKTYLRRLGLNEMMTGIRFDEFQEEQNKSKNIIGNIISILRRLSDFDKENM